MQKFVTTGIKQQPPQRGGSNRHVFTVGAVDVRLGEDDNLSSIQKAIKSMNTIRRLETVDSTRSSPTVLAVNALVDQKRVLASMLFDIDEYKATKRSLGHQENEIALELKRLQNSNYLPSTVTLGRSLSRQRSRLHCSQIDFTGQTANIDDDDDEYTIPRKPKVNERSSPTKPYPDCGQTTKANLYSDYCTYEEPYSVTKINKAVAEEKRNGADNGISLTCKNDKNNNSSNGTISSCLGHANSNGSLLTDQSEHKTRLPLDVAATNRKRLLGNNDFKYHGYLCVGILVAFLIWAVIYFPVTYILRSNDASNKVATVVVTSTVSGP